MEKKLLYITFIIEKNGTISNLRVVNWVNDAVDEKFKKELIVIALKTLKEDYNHWNPGKYKGNIIRTENTTARQKQNKGESVRFHRPPVYWIPTT